MGGVESKQKEFFQALRNLPDGKNFEEAKKSLTEADEKFSLSTVIEEDTQMNILMVVMSCLKPQGREHHLDFVKKHLKEFDLKYVNPKSGFTILHILASRVPGNYVAYVPPPPHSEDPEASKSHHKKRPDPKEVEKHRPSARQQFHMTLGDLAEQLLAEGADIDVRDKKGRTALMLAATHQQVLVVRELCGAGAEVNFLTADGDSPLLSAIRGGSVDCVSQILALCKSEVKMNAYYLNKGAAYVEESSSSPKTERKAADPPLVVALKNQRKEVFEFLIKNNFELTDWYELRLLVPDAAEIEFVPGKNESDGKKKIPEVRHNNNDDGDDENSDGPTLSRAFIDKFFQNTPRYGPKTQPRLADAAPLREDIGNDLHGRPIFEACAGNSLAQAALLRSFGAFEILVEQYDPRLPFAKFPKNESILHVIASHKVDTTGQSDSAIDFVDAIREKCAKYSADGDYDWNVENSDGLTPLDYCKLANEKPLSIGARSAKQRRHHSIRKPFTALILIETLKHYPADGNEIELLVADATDDEVLQVLSVAPPPLAAKITRIAFQNCFFDDMTVGAFAENFPNLEELVLIQLSEVRDVVERLLGQYGVKKARQAKSKEEDGKPHSYDDVQPTDYRPTKLKKIYIADCDKIPESKVEHYRRDDLEIEWKA